MRIEKDYIGTLEIPDNALYGVHSLRAKNNFPNNAPFNITWYKSMAYVKLACYITYKDFKEAALKSYPSTKLPFLDDKVINALIQAAKELTEGRHFEHFIVPAVQGGAGTSINMNINEIITNLALVKSGYKPGEYDKIHPIEAANIYQSTNDTVPTALKLAVMMRLNDLETAINELRFTIEQLEKKYRNVLRSGYTQMQLAVPTTYGKLFSAYNDALGRDWWRISKCFERIKIVNLGGSAIGTSLTVPRYFVMNVVQKLRQITKQPVTKAENLVDATSNLDAIVEVHGILKANAVNFEKIVSDIRLLASDLAGNGEMEIPQKQVGSSIMPSKINPVIPEYVISVAHKVYANDILIAQLAGLGNLELNANLPLIGHSILESIDLLISAAETMNKNLFQGLKINSKQAEQNLYRNPSVTTALIPFTGYLKASELAKLMRQENIDIFTANEKLKIIDNNRLKELLQASMITKNGFSLKEIE